MEAEDKTYTFSATRDYGFKLNADVAVRFGGTTTVEAVTAPLGFGINTQVLKTTAAGGPRIAVETAHGWLDEASVAFGLSTAKATSLELRGRFAPGTEVGISKVPRLFLPENLGQALVKSETADVFALRLRHNGALIAYQFRPNPDIPKDVNILSFQIDPAYTTQGTLDGKIGSEAHQSFPNALQRSSDWSYFKPIEAYKLKGDIDKKAADLQTLYDQYDARQNAHLSRFAAGSLADRYRPLQAGKAKRSLVNTYVWTADGGFYAETQESSDTFVESTGGSFEFTGSAGGGIVTDLEIGPVEFNLTLNVLFTGYYKLEETKSLESKTAYSLDVDIDKVERDIMQRDANGKTITRNGRVQRVPGKVDAYRFMTFRLEPSSDNFEAFFNKVVDQAWLQTNDPNAVALRGARQPGKKPPCWRVLHRVTFVSRVLEEVAGDGDAPTLVQTMRQVDIDSNFELIKQFEPYVIDLLHDLNAFTRAIDDRINQALPALKDHRLEITSFLMDYYGLSSLLLAGQGQDSAFGEASFLEHSVNAPPAIAILGDEKRVVVLEGASCELELLAQVTDDRLTPDAVFLTWKGPDHVSFSDIHAAKPKAVFTRRGRYDITVTADDGKLTGTDTITVLVNEPPRLAIAAPGEPKKDGASWTLDLKATLQDDGRADDTSDSGTVTLEWQPQPNLSFSNKSQLETTVTFIAPGLYALQLVATNGKAVGRAEVSVSIASRAFQGLQTFYTFERGAGSVIEDVAGVDNPVNLACDLTKAEWVPGGLRVQQAGAIQPGDASPLAPRTSKSGLPTSSLWKPGSSPPLSMAAAWRGWSPSAPPIACS